jgi:hypothetical protein
MHSYAMWFDSLLDPAVDNSVAKYVSNARKELDTTDAYLRTSPFGPSIANPGSPQPAYCLEHQICNDPLHWGIPWTRFYAIVTIHQKQESKEKFWLVDDTEPVMKVEVYSRVTAPAPSDTWYTAKPPWQGAPDTYGNGTAVDAFDLHDFKGFQGQTGEERRRDIENSIKWQKWLKSTFPELKSKLVENNDLRRKWRSAEDVKETIEATRGLVTKAQNGTVLITDTVD